MQKYARLFGVIEWVLQPPSPCDSPLGPSPRILWLVLFQFRFQMMRAWPKPIKCNVACSQNKAQITFQITQNNWDLNLNYCPTAARERVSGQSLSIASYAYVELEIDNVSGLKSCTRWANHNLQCGPAIWQAPTGHRYPLQEDHGSCCLSCCCRCSCCCCCCFCWACHTCWGLLLLLQAGKLCELSMNLYAFDWFILCCWRRA